MNKIYRAFRGVILMITCTRSFDRSLFRDRRIALVGPADSALNTGKGSYINSFDLVIRINKAPLLVKSAKYAADIGSKTDVLFHSFFENDHSGGGLLDLDLYRELGIRYLIKPTPTLSGYRDIFNFYKKYLKKYRVYTLPFLPAKELKLRFGSFRPTNGFCALKCAMESDFAELYITGFTFFKTGYVAGYRDAMKEGDQARKYIAEMKIHNPDIEFKEFKRILNENADKNIIVDDTIKAILRDSKD